VGKKHAEISFSLWDLKIVCNSAAEKKKGISPIFSYLR
jgi:hypothetical protein